MALQEYKEVKPSPDFNLINIWYKNKKFNLQCHKPEKTNSTFAVAFS